MIYLSVCLACDAAAALCGFSRPEEADQFWLDPSAQIDGEEAPRLEEEAFDDSRVQWFRSPRIAYVLRDDQARLD